ncbi:hypothetical protein [Coleofasciculus sp.]|uniref:hypothetical protein n=1 Tax=Coleofasciculus sp. TaxID=3100458 RepID=UPI0040633087
MACSYYPLTVERSDFMVANSPNPVQEDQGDGGVEAGLVTPVQAKMQQMFICFRC